MHTNVILTNKRRTHTQSNYTNTKKNKKKLNCVTWTFFVTCYKDSYEYPVSGLPSNSAHVVLGSRSAAADSSLLAKQHKTAGRWWNTNQHIAKQNNRLAQHSKLKTWPSFLRGGNYAWNTVAESIFVNLVRAALVETAARDVVTVWHRAAVLRGGWFIETDPTHGPAIDFTTSTTDRQTDAQTDGRTDGPATTSAHLCVPRTSSLGDFTFWLIRWAKVLRAKVWSKYVLRPKFWLDLSQVKKWSSPLAHGLYDTIR